MHKKEPQKPPEHASEHVKPQNFLGACPQTPLSQSILRGCLFTQSHADHVIGLQDERSLHIDEGQSVLDTGTCVLKAGGVCAPPQVRKLYK